MISDVVATKRVSQQGVQGLAVIGKQVLCGLQQRGICNAELWARCVSRCRSFTSVTNIPHMNIESRLLTIVSK